MKKPLPYLLTFLLLIVFTAATASAAGPFALERAAGILKNAKKCYIIGGFKLLHTIDPSLGDIEELSTSRDLNGQCVFHFKVDVLNTETNHSYVFDVNPVTGSNNVRYYRNARSLEWNDKNPYWIIEVPAGTYEVNNFSCMVTISLSGYQPFTEKWIDAPVSKGIKRTVNFSVADKQIVYIGDYQCSVASYICLNKLNSIYWPCRLAIDLTDNFDAVHEDLLNLAKDHRTDMEIVNGL